MDGRSATYDGGLYKINNGSRGIPVYNTGFFMHMKNTQVITSVTKDPALIIKIIITGINNNNKLFQY